MWLDFVDQVGFTKYTPWQSSYINKENDKDTPCSELWRRTFVWYDGKVNPCDYDYKSKKLSVGDINNDKLVTIWKNGKYNHLRNEHLSKCRKNYDPCKRCPME